MQFYSINFDIHNLDSNIIRLACTIQLRVLIVALKYCGQKFTSENIASELKKNMEDVEEALEFWINLKIIKSDGNQNSNLNINKIIKKSKNDVTINRDYISDRLKSDKEIKDFLDEIETIMCRPLSGLDISLMLSLKDNEGIPYNVILMLVQYCIKNGKSSTRYIEKVGIDWAQKGIDSIDKAEQKINQLNNSKKLWKKFEKIIGTPSRTPTNREEETINRWFVEWEYDEEMIKEAYDRCIHSKGRYILNYMDGIIKRWKQSNIKTTSEIKKKSKKISSFEPSYDISEYQANYI